MTYADKEIQGLLDQLKERKAELGELLDKVTDHWVEEDYVYRFYHQSFKVYWLQGHTRELVEVLQELAPCAQLNEWFLELVGAGTGKVFAPEHNSRWLEETRPILEAFWHAKYMLEQAVKYADKYEQPPRMLDSGFASLLSLYGWR